VRAPRRFPTALVSALLITTTTLALACARERGPDESRDDPSEATRSPQQAEREALAAAIDPGPVTPISADLPPWIAEQVASTRTRRRVKTKSPAIMNSKAKNRRSAFCTRASSCTRGE
jgi:hypothetical protein